MKRPMHQRLPQKTCKEPCLYAAKYEPVLAWLSLPASPAAPSWKPSTSTLARAGLPLNPEQPTSSAPGISGGSMAAKTGRSSRALLHIAQTPLVVGQSLHRQKRPQSPAAVPTDATLAACLAVAALRCHLPVHQRPATVKPQVKAHHLLKSTADPSRCVRDAATCTAPAASPLCEVSGSHLRRPCV